jgi:hypothetical protein
MGRIPKATAVLEEAQRVVPADAPCRCFLLANLASAYQENNDLLHRAIDTQNLALKAWPKEWPGWKPGEGLWYRRAEAYARDLMLLRQAESRSTRGTVGSFQAPDALFPGVRFVGEKDDYEAGRIQFLAWNKLPFDAEAIVLQLQFWQPMDDRLYWQYGELLNARGEVEEATRVLGDLVKNRGRENVKSLRQHYLVLRDAKKSKEGAANAEMQDWGRWLTIPGGQSETPATPPLVSTKTNWLPDWRQVTVSFVTGVIVALLGMLQWQQWRRRRQVAAFAREENGRSYG